MLTVPMCVLRLLDDTMKDSITKEFCDLLEN